MKQIDYWSSENTDCLTADQGTHQQARTKRSAHKLSIKEKFYGRTGAMVRSKLYPSSAKKRENISSLNYFYSSPYAIRNEVRLNISRHNPLLPNIVNGWCERYPQYSEIIRPLVDDNTRYVNKVRTGVFNELVSLHKLDADELANELKTLAKSGELEHPIIKYLNLTPIEDTRRKNGISERLKKRKSNKQSYTLGFITRVTKECLLSDDFNHLALGIALATGRRAVEVIHQGTFKVVNDNFILFGGKAKKGRGVYVKLYKLLQDVANDPKTTLGPDKHKNEWSGKIVDDGSQVWVQIRNGNVINGGINKTPKTFNSETGLSASERPSWK